VLASKKWTPSVVTADAVAKLELKVGDSIVALFNSHQVMILRDTAKNYDLCPAYTIWDSFIQLKSYMPESI